MAKGYFDADGKVICVTEIDTPMTNPLGTVFVAAIPDELTANDVFYDVGTNEPKARMTLPITIERNLITGVPTGSRVIVVRGEVIETVDDGSVEFEADVEADISVYIDHPFYVPQLVTVQTGPQESE